MATSKNVNIPLEEYKALLLKETPTQADKLIVQALLDSIKSHSKIVNQDEYRSDFKGIEFKDEAKILKEVLTVIYMLDRPSFIEMYKEMVREDIKDEINILNAEYMRKIKELKNDKE